MLFVIVLQLSFVQPYLLSVYSLCELLFGHMFVWARQKAFGLLWINV